MIKHLSGSGPATLDEGTYYTPAERAVWLKRESARLLARSRELLTQAEALEAQVVRCGGEEVERMLRPVIRPVSRPEPVSRPDALH